MSVNLAEQLGSRGRLPFRAVFRFLFQLEERLLRGRWAAPRAMERCLSPSPQQQTNGANATSRNGRRSGNGGESLRCSMLVSSHSSRVRWIVGGPLFFVFFRRGCQLFNCQNCPTLHLSFVFCVLKANLNDKNTSANFHRVIEAPSFDKVRRRFHASVSARDKNNWPNTAQRL